MKKRLDLREVREMQGFTLRELAKEAGVNYSTIWQLEKGFGENVSSIMKAKIARALHVEMFRLFPEEQSKMKDIYLSHRFRMLEDYFPKIEFIDPRAVDKILGKMALDDFDEIFHSGTSEKKAIEVLRKYAKKYNLAEPEVK